MSEMSSVSSVSELAFSQDPMRIGGGGGGEQNGGGDGGDTPFGVPSLF